MYTWMLQEKASSAMEKYKQELKRSLLSYTAFRAELS